MNTCVSINLWKGPTQTHFIPRIIMLNVDFNKTLKAWDWANLPSHSSHILTLAKRWYCGNSRFISLLNIYPPSLKQRWYKLLKSVTRCHWMSPDARGHMLTWLRLRCLTSHNITSWLTSFHVTALSHSPPPTLNTGVTPTLTGSGSVTIRLRDIIWGSGF